MQRPLHLAAKRNFLATCRILLRNGSNPSSVDAEERTALELLPAELHPEKFSHFDIELYLFPEARKKRDSNQRGRSVTASPGVLPSPLTSSAPLTPVSFSSPPGSAGTGSNNNNKKSIRRLSFFGGSKQPKSPSPGSSSPQLVKRKEKVTGTIGGTRRRSLSTEDVGSDRIK